MIRKMVVPFAETGGTNYWTNSSYTVCSCLPKTSQLPTPVNPYCIQSRLIWHSWPLLLLEAPFSLSSQNTTLFAGLLLLIKPSSQGSVPQGSVLSPLLFPSTHSSLVTSPKQSKTVTTKYIKPPKSVFPTRTFSLPEPPTQLSSAHCYWDVSAAP